MILGKPKKTKEIDEISFYINEFEEDVICDPLIWWKKNEEKYPLLSQMARKYLCIQASSSESESVFSDLTNLITDKRFSLLPENVCKLLFCKKNSNLVPNLLQYYVWDYKSL